VSPRTRARFVALPTLLRRRFPALADPAATIASGHVLVDGAPVSNPAARVRADASVRIVGPRTLRGTLKLQGALEALAVDARAVVALDVGAAAGGFTHALLDAGAARVYAVDAGVGQLRGWLRADPRVVNLEGTNLAHLGPESVPEPVGLVTMDLSYLSVADALPQLGRTPLATGARLVALVKPTYELHRRTLAADEASVERAVAQVGRAMERQGWEVLHAVRSPVTGWKGAVEVFVSARLRARGTGSANGGSSATRPPPRPG
jgi:23S rRNA (cytidine1920-2'-O)/16S rRNA (cytidine1409-2'-O)-methyltransferase